MGIALQKTFVFIVLIGIGILLKSKIQTKEEMKGVKALILNIALPATIFIALLKIEIKPALILLPILALAVNILLWLGSKLFIKIAQLNPDSPRSRTFQLLIPSFAPGLSCFPFITEFLGEESLAMAAFADVGNKIFVLIILYVVSMHWYYQLVAKQRLKIDRNNSRLKDLGLSLLREPINMVLLIAILMLCFGFNLQSLPIFLQDSIGRMSVLMTPMVLIFIGIAVKLRKGEIGLILQALLWRSGFAFLISVIILFCLPADTPLFIKLLAVIFPQSACSFWPFAHMTAVETLELDQPALQTFELDFALNILALSLPFSTILVLGICSSGDLFANTAVISGVGLFFISLSLLPLLWKIKTNNDPAIRFEEVGTFSKESN